ncbi:bifunctional DNA primase/polymerase [Streptomyces sp. AJS327]|uniref:bifunctional DNA primase/polymerase n=1 Tax=Streptomyces sp. AJS327 TaxID=2545265 RepID=UPI0015E03776|nr:bifunctional DNA primase/polymerase [Streptomyces sp. AJS327]MBA0052719.1 bifunctional DNA primase/polymerase [Streptomyces sp. AJS327]
MREILGRRRMPRSSLRNAALDCATRWRWPVVPGVGTASSSSRAPGRSEACQCPDADCAVPGAHPLDPVLLAATTDPRMVSWWWTERPGASLILATGGDAPCALSLPAIAGERALAALDGAGVRLGPVLATPTRYSVLVAPYLLEELGELLYSYDRVPSSLRFHSAGGYVALPPSRTGGGMVRWDRRPVAEGPGETPWLPRVVDVLDVLVEESGSVPDTGSTLRY